MASDYANSAAYFSRALELKPGYLPLYFSRAIALLASDSAISAIETYQTWIEIALSGVEGASADVEKVMADLTELTSKRPDLADEGKRVLDLLQSALEQLEP